MDGVPPVTTELLSEPVDIRRGQRLPTCQRNCPFALNRVVFSTTPAIRASISANLVARLSSLVGVSADATASASLHRLPQTQNDTVRAMTTMLPMRYRPVAMAKERLLKRRAAGSAMGSVNSFMT